MLLRVGDYLNRREEELRLGKCAANRGMRFCGDYLDGSSRAYRLVFRSTIAETPLSIRTEIESTAVAIESAWEESTGTDTG